MHDADLGRPPNPVGHYVSAAYLAAYIDVARAEDIDPYFHLRIAKLPTSFTHDPLLKIPRDRFLALLEASASAAGRPDFNLRVIRALSLSAMGPIAVLASAQPTVRAGLAVLCDHSARAQTAMRAILEPRGETTLIRFSLKLGAPAARSFQSFRSPELAVGTGLRAIQGLIGDAWRPLRTTLSSPPPRDPAPYQALFGEVAFGEAFESMTVATRDLDRPLATANPSLAWLAENFLGAQTGPRNRSFQQEVRELIAALLPRGACTIERLSQHMGVGRRTVHRRLAEDGVTFSDLVEAARRELVAGSISVPGRPIGELAQSLGFTSKSTFSRWFRHTYGASARTFRKAA